MSSWSVMSEAPIPACVLDMSSFVSVFQDVPQSDHSLLHPHKQRRELQTLTSISSSAFSDWSFSLAVWSQLRLHHLTAEFPCSLLGHCFPNTKGEMIVQGREGRKPERKRLGKGKGRKSRGVAAELPSLSPLWDLPLARGTATAPSDSEPH